jgi:hypothetical protein
MDRVGADSLYLSIIRENQPHRFSISTNERLRDDGVTNPPKRRGHRLERQVAEGGPCNTPAFFFGQARSTFIAYVRPQ